MSRRSLSPKWRGRKRKDAKHSARPRSRPTTIAVWGGRGLSVPSPPPAAVAQGSVEASGSEETEDTEEIEEEDPTQTEAYWRDRKAAIERRISDIESQLNRPGFSSDPSNMMRRTQLEQQLEQARSDLAALQADARRQGIPPGWV